VLRKLKKLIALEVAEFFCMVDQYRDVMEEADDEDITLEDGSGNHRLTKADGSFVAKHRESTNTFGPYL
jgi:hypothetical protein